MYYNIFLLVNGYITQSESQMSKPDTLCGGCPGIILHISQQESVHMLVNWKRKCLFTKKFRGRTIRLVRFFQLHYTHKPRFDGTEIPEI